MNPADATSAAELDRAFGCIDDEPTFVCETCGHEIAGLITDDGRCGACRDLRVQMTASAADPRRA